MIKADITDKKLVIELLCRSFENNQSINYIIPQDNTRSARIRALMAYSFEICLLFGDVWLSGDRKACALILYPHQKRVTLKSLWLDLNLILFAVGLSGINKVMKRENLVKDRQPKEKMAYLWFIGTDPEFQHAGIGSTLLKEVIAASAKMNLPVYLETSTTQNLPWYKHFGFQVYDELTLTYTLYFLKLPRPDKY